MIIKSSLDIYDVQVLNLVQEKFPTLENTKFQFAPIDLAFSFAEKKYGQKILPLYNIFRIDTVSLSNSMSSIALYKDEFMISKDISVEYLLVNLKYQIDFFSKNIQDCNISDIDFFKFQRDASLYFDFKDYGLDEKFDPNIVFDPIADSSDYTKFFTDQLLFRRSYSFVLTTPIFDVKQNATFDKFKLNIGVYNDGDIDIIKQIEVDYIEE